MKNTYDLPPSISDAPRIIHNADNFVEANEGQCDCACAANSPSLQRPVAFLANAPYSSNSVTSIPLTANDYAVLVEQTPTPIVLNQSALTIANHFAQPRPLAGTPQAWNEAWGETAVQSSLKQMVSLGLLVTQDYKTLPFAEAPTTLSAWLHLTDRCNLRCAYCYLPHHQLDMSPETGRAAIDATFRSALAHGYSQVKLKYAGGEPLLRFPLAAELHQYAQTLADRRNIGLDGVLLSNGTLLTAEIIQTMQTLGLRLMISMDGLGAFHDQQRHYADGRGSSTDVTQAVELALTRGLIPDISITVSSRNVEGLPELISWILERDLPFGLNFYRQNDFSASITDLQLEEEKIIEGMLAAFKVIEENLPRRSLLASLIDRANLSTPHLRACSVGDSYLAFNHRGQVAKCQMQMDHLITSALSEDPLALIRTDKTGIQNISVEKKEDCRDCQWKYWCAGGCPLETHRVTGRYEVKSPNCNIYKTLFPEAIRLEGLRLLEYADEFQVDANLHLR